MVKKTWIVLLILFAVMCFAVMADAKLTVIGTATYNGNDYNMIYEDDQELIWLDYSHPSNRWAQQVEWVTGLNNPGTLTYNFNSGISVSWKSDWRLPKTVDGVRRYGYDGTTTAGFNITSSEMGHLYYKSLENKGYYDTNGKPRPGWGQPESEHGWGLKNTGPFKNLQAVRYWSGTEYSIYPDLAWDFQMYFGAQGNLSFKSSYNSAVLAVRQGKVTE